MSKPGSKKGFLGYFVTHAGRKVVVTCAGATAISLFLGNYVPQTFLLGKYREFVQNYRHGIERKMPEKVLNRINIAMEKLNLHPFEKKIIKPFVVIGFDTFTGGSLKYRFGGLLGLPWNYSYETVGNIEKQDIRFRNELIKWNSEQGKLLEESLILTEQEQIFAICKSILQLQTHRVLLNSIYPSATFIFVYTVGNIINQKLNLYARPLSLRLCLYSILSVFGLGVWSFAKDFTQVQYDTSIDRTLCDLGPEFIDAGVRYYDKLLKKNMALRALLEDNTYTARGNENYFLRQKSLPITIRKSYFEMRMEELKKNLEEKQTNVM